jgi:hypothetical protein
VSAPKLDPINSTLAGDVVESAAEADDAFRAAPVRAGLFWHGSQLVAQVHGQRGHRDREEYGPSRELAGAHAQVRNERAEEIQYEASGSE